MTTQHSDDSLMRPYAPSANIVAFLQRVRNTNMPAKITREFLVGAGISESVLARVYSTIRFLNLIDPDDSPTDTLRELASGTAQDYHRLLARLYAIQAA